MPYTSVAKLAGNMLVLFVVVWGMFSGWLAHLLIERHKRPNWPVLFLSGLGGSIVGGFLVSLLSGDGLAFKPPGFIGSVAGAVIVLWCVLAVTARRSAAH